MGEKPHVMYHSGGGHAMNLRQLFTINVFLASFFGLTCALVPRQLCSIYGLPLDTAGVWVARLLGGSLLGLATLMWFGRRSPSMETRRAIALALLIQDSVGLVASLSIQLDGQMAATGWSNVALYGLLAAGYAYFLLLEPGRI
jgi:hypothetical protein